MEKEEKAKKAERGQTDARLLGTDPGGVQRHDPAQPEADELDGRIAVHNSSAHSSREGQLRKPGRRGDQQRDALRRRTALLFENAAVLSRR